MTRSSSSARLWFWCFLALEATGSQVLIWTGLPVYRRLRTATNAGATPRELAIALAAVVMMQSAHWIAFRLKSRLQFRRNVVWGHVLICIGELSLFFSAALATLIVFDRLDELVFSFGKLFVIGAILFAVTSYKYQLQSLGERYLAAEPETH